MYLHSRKGDFGGPCASAWVNLCIKAPLVTIFNFLMSEGCAQPMCVTGSAFGDMIMWIMFSSTAGYWPPDWWGSLHGSGLSGLGPVTGLMFGGCPHSAWLQVLCWGGVALPSVLFAPPRTADVLPRYKVRAARPRTIPLFCGPPRRPCHALRIGFPLAPAGLQYRNAFVPCCPVTGSNLAAPHSGDRGCFTGLL